MCGILLITSSLPPPTTALLADLLAKQTQAALFQRSLECSQDDSFYTVGTKSLFCVDSNENHLVDAIQRRGPDLPGRVFSIGVGRNCFKIVNNINELDNNVYKYDEYLADCETQLYQKYIKLYGSVLHLRGKHACPQPLTRSTAAGWCSLLWNGEIFGGLDCLGSLDSEEYSDTSWLHQLLTNCKSPKDIMELFDSIKGPFSTIFIWRDQLWFGRDKLGRRSLLFTETCDGGFCLSSSAPLDNKSIPVDGGTWKEVPVGALFVVPFLAFSGSGDAPFMVPWRCPAPFYTDSFWNPKNSVEAPGIVGSAVIESFKKTLAQSVKLRSAKTAKKDGFVGLLFSGGADSTVMAALTIEAIPSNCVVELSNVAFDPYEAPDRLTALKSFEELLQLYPTRDIRLVCVDVTRDEVREHESTIVGLTGSKCTHMDFNIGAALFFAARGKGYLCSRDFPTADWWQHLWYGSPENLRGVSFPKLPENLSRTQRIQKITKEIETEPFHNSSCSICKLKYRIGCVHTCCRLCCNKLTDTSGCQTTPVIHLAGRGLVKVHFPIYGMCPVHKNKSYVPVASTENRVKHRPEESGRDKYNSGISKSKNSCLEARFSPQWYHSCGFGSERCACKYTCQSRVWLVGTGADELLAGYSRHGTAQRRDGEEGLRDELLKDLKRLWVRNLGRDDRCISVHGKEARHPFLDEDVVSFVGSLPLHTLLRPTTNQGREISNKWILRETAKCLGLKACVEFRKRAIQFGSRISKCSNLMQFGSIRKADGAALYKPKGKPLMSAASPGEP